MTQGADHKSNHIWPIVYEATADFVNGDLTVKQHHYVQTLWKKKKVWIVVFNAVVTCLCQPPDEKLRPRPNQKLKKEVTMKTSPCVDTEQ